jgi:isopentenyl phosphate kinase
MAPERRAAETLYLKLGGSLITDKRVPESPRVEVLARLAHEVAAVRAARPDLRLVIGHGSGSFGHVAGKRYGTRHGVQSADDWFGFAVVADAAARLNRMVTAALLGAGVPAWSVQPSVALRCVDGVVVDGPLLAVERALDAGLVPLVYGDVALDDVRGGTIAGTEEIFEWLGNGLPPARMVLAGEVAAIYSADPLLDPNARPIAEVTPATLGEIAHGLGASHGVDVTGGMVAKVAQSLALVERHAGLEIIICSGLQPGAVQAALLGELPTPSTRIHA